YLSKVDNYYRYQISSGSGDVLRGEYGQVVETRSNAPGFPQLGVSGSKNGWKYFQVSVPSGVTKLVVSTSGGSGDMDLYVRNGSNPTGSQYICRSQKNNSTEYCEINSPDNSTYYVGMLAYSNYSGVDLNVEFVTTNSCDGDSAGAWGWIN